jgi:hypothetical protein
VVTDNADDLVPFLQVRVISSTVPALFCRIGQKNVWLPREHISGKLWRAGDRGKLFVRRWIARDRGLIDTQGAAIGPLTPLPSRPGVPGHLHLVRADERAHRAK